MKIDLDICVCLNCRVLYQENMLKQKRLYQEKDGRGHHGIAFKCVCCNKYIIIWKDYGIDTEYLDKTLGENNYLYDKEE